MNYPLFLARRLSLGSSGRRSSPAVRVASAAVALSVAVMLASIAIVSGFKQEITRKVVGFNSDLQITLAESADNDNVLNLRAPVAELLDSVPQIVDWSLTVSIPGVFKTPTDFKGIYLRSMSDLSTASFLKENLEEGRLPEKPEEILVSRSAARKLGLKSGEKIDTYFFTTDIKARRFLISGIFNSHFDRYDDILAYTPMETLQKVAGLEEWQGSGVKIRLNDFGKAEEVAAVVQYELDMATINGLLSEQYLVTTATSAGAGFFQWLQLLDTNVLVILILMTVVGCMTLVSGMLIIILDKKRFIGLMKAMGARTKDIRKIFVWLAIRVAVAGMGIGNALMLGALYAQQRWHLIPLDPEAYYIDFVPVSIDWRQVVLLNVGVALVIWAVLILPSRFVAGIRPSETMRDE